MKHVLLHAAKSMLFKCFVCLFVLIYLFIFKTDA